MTDFRTPDQIELDALRQVVVDLLAECTEPQVAFFHRIYPHGVEKMKRDELRNAVGLCQRTIRKKATGAIYSDASPSTEKPHG